MEKPKKILIFSTAYYPFVGGAEVAVKEITDRMSDIQFDLITSKIKADLPKAEKIGNVTVYRIGIGINLIDKALLSLFGASQALRLHKKNKYDIAWSIMASQASIAAARFKAKAPGVKLVLTLQEGDEESHLKRYVLGSDLLYRLLIRPLHLLVFKRADQGTAISNYLIKRMRDNGMIVPIDLIPNGVDVEKFDKEISEEEKMSIRDRLGLGAEDVALVTTSRLVVKNGVRDVIDALKFLPANVKFVVFGTGELEKSLKLRAKSLELVDRVIWKGYVPHSEMPKYLKACDIFIRASLSEGFGNSFIEAMAAKVPVIGTPVGGIVDFLKERETGYLCQPENPRSVAEAVKNILSDKKRDKIIENAYIMAKDKYDWGLVSSQMRAVFNNL